MEKPKAQCRNCGLILAEERIECPNCGKNEVFLFKLTDLKDPAVDEQVLEKEADIIFEKLKKEIDVMAYYKVLAEQLEELVSQASKRLIREYDIDGSLRLLHSLTLKDKVLWKMLKECPGNLDLTPIS